MGIDRRENGFLRLVVKFGGKATDHPGKGITHAADSLGGGTNRQLVDLVGGVNFGVVFLEDNGCVELITDGPVPGLRLFANFDPRKALPFHLVRGVDHIGGWCG